MHTCVLRIVLIFGGMGLCGLAACTSDASLAARGSGALPTLATDRAPVLNAATVVAHGHLLERQGRFEQAVAQYRRALDFRPDLVTARNRLAITLNKLGRHAEATREFDVAIAAQPDWAFLHNNLGWSLILEQRYTEAIAALDRALELEPTFTRAHMNRAVALAKLKQWDEARTAFGEAVPTADAYYNVAVMQAEAGEFVAATRSLERALALNPELTCARDELREISRWAAEQEAVERTRAAALSAETVVLPEGIAPPSGADTGYVHAADATSDPSPERATPATPDAAGANTTPDAPPTATLPIARRTMPETRVSLPADVPSAEELARKIDAWLAASDQPESTTADAQAAASTALECFIRTLLGDGVRRDECLRWFERNGGASTERADHVARGTP